MIEKTFTDKGVLGKIQGLSNMVGNTPIFEIELLFRGKKRTVYAKAEFLNLSGSIKDRMAFHIIREAYSTGRIKEGDRIVEATSGNTGIAFASVGRALGHPVTIFMPDWMSDERKNLIRSLGADIVLVSREEGGFVGSIARTREMAVKEDGVFLPRQFENPDNVMAHYNTTGPEIWWQLKFYGKRPDLFVAGVGTGGTIMGTGRYLKEMNQSIKLYPLEPSNSPTLTTGYKVGVHRIQGISDEFIPDIVKLDQLDEVVAVDDGDSIIMAQNLAKELGIAVGISSGANFLGAVLKQEELGDEATAVTVFSDDNKKYLSTGLMKQEPVKPGFISSEIKLLSFKVLRRSCVMCCNPSECEAVHSPRFLEGSDMPSCFLKGRINCCS
jgi:cysteine synthase A